MAVNLPFFLVKKALAFLGDNKRRSFIEACKNPEETQKNLKASLLENSLHSFPATFTSYIDYQKKAALTKEPVSFYETTSGSTGAKKEIPYTRSLLKSFENMFILWAHDLVFHGNLSLQNGKFFMSVSPQIGEMNKDDRKYLSPALNLLLTPFLTSNPNDHKGKTAHDFFMKISLDLIKAKELEVISIWSPTYLLSLLDFMESHRADLELRNTKLSSLWPKLKLISCWTHGQAARSSRVLQEKFPGVKIQSKGLLLTEGAVTIPWTEAGGNLPLLTETYLEFVSEDEKIFLLHELKRNSVYRVIMSQKNGFLRYDTKDLIKVTSFYFKTPVLEFIGRAESVCDLAGEKISETILQKLFQDIKSTMLFVPEISDELPSYKLYIDESNNSDIDWDKKLATNYHYQLARDLGQLKPLNVIKVRDLNQKYLAFYQSRGMILGDIKEKMLLSNLDEAENFMKWIAKELQSSQ